MRKARYVIVDVFAEKPFGGNPLAVFPDGSNLSSKEMQLLARELNLSETTFVLPPTKGSGADFRVRIFVPDMEIGYAGHPTIGTFYVLAREGRIKLTGPVTTVSMEAKAGVMPVEIHSSRGKIAKVVTVQKKPQFMKVFKDVGPIAEALCLRKSDFMPDRAPVELVSTGLPWVIACVRSREAVERATPNVAAFADFVRSLPRPVVDVYVTCLDPVDRGSTTHSRGFSLVAKNVVEDPATGSASGCLGAYLVQRKLVGVAPRTTIVNEQGYEIGRPSKIDIEVLTGRGGEVRRVAVGGSVAHVMDGTAYL